MNMANAKCYEHGGKDQVFGRLVKSCKSDRERKIDVSNIISKQDIAELFQQQQGRCYYCGIDVSLIAGTRHADNISIDRIHNTLYHCKDNVVMTCLFCNFAKNDTEFALFVKGYEIIITGSEDHLPHAQIPNWFHYIRTNSVKNAKLPNVDPEVVVEIVERQNNRCAMSHRKFCFCAVRFCPLRPSLDRIDNNEGYEIDNVQFVCMCLNFGRENTSFENALLSIERRKQSFHHRSTQNITYTPKEDPGERMLQELQICKCCLKENFAWGLIYYDEFLHTNICLSCKKERNSKLYAFDFSNSETIYFDKNRWEFVKLNYDKDFVVSKLSEIVDKFSIPYPFPEFEQSQCRRQFFLLRNIDLKDYVIPDTWKFKQNYDYENDEANLKKLPFYVNGNNNALCCSNEFAIRERLNTGRCDKESVLHIWNTPELRKEIFKGLFNISFREITPASIRKLFEWRTRCPGQFRPTNAAALYKLFDAHNVLDFSAGWGDRLVAALAIGNVVSYIGIDPNDRLHEVYENIVREYGDDTTKVRFINSAAEDVVLESNQFDFIFSSPPYFDTETYDNGNPKQSHMRYKKFDDWLHKFLFKTIRNVWHSLQPGGYLAINVSDVVRMTRLKIVENMLLFVEKNIEDAVYLGCMGMRVPKHMRHAYSENIGRNESNVSGQPIFIWQKRSTCTATSIEAIYSERVLGTRYIPGDSHGSENESMDYDFNDKNSNQYNDEGPSHGYRFEEGPSNQYSDEGPSHGYRFKEGPDVQYNDEGPSHGYRYEEGPNNQYSDEGPSHGLRQNEKSHIHNDEGTSHRPNVVPNVHFEENSTEYETNMKKCIRCQKEMSIQHFNWENKAKKLRKPRCRTCQKEIRNIIKTRDNSSSKICSGEYGCGKQKPLSEFNWYNENKGLRQTTCKECQTSNFRLVQKSQSLSLRGLEPTYWLKIDGQVQARRGNAYTRRTPYIIELLVPVDVFFSDPDVRPYALRADPESAIRSALHADPFQFNANENVYSYTG
jgi:hypothetical protein